ncbi:MAG TPA: branched-chain amino acid ABC transporter permease [Anaerolineae bacterium]|nr:branched-chain amino acid ABC transporter permease [Anaerolineae bacterium]
MDASFWVLQTLNGITLGALLFLVASGFTLIFGLMRIANLTHGVLYMLAGYLALTAVRAGHSYWLAVAVAVGAAGLLGVLIERVFLRRLRGKTLAEVLITVGIGFIVADICLMLWGGDPLTIPVPDMIRGTVTFLGVSYPRFRLFTLALGTVLAVGLWFLQYRTRLGAIVRAGVDDGEMVSALGINLPLVLSGVFILGAALAGLAGAVGGNFLSLYRGADQYILLLGLVVVIVGGMGSLEGAVVGSLLVGLVDAYGKALVPDLAYFTQFGPMVLMLALRPQGLFGRKE